MPHPIIRAGLPIDALLLQGMQWQTVAQGSDVTVTNSTGMLDTNLSISAESGGEYLGLLLLSYRTSNTAGMDTDWADTTSGSGNRFAFGIGTDTVSRNNAEAVMFRRGNLATNLHAGGSGTGADGDSAPHSYLEVVNFNAGTDGEFTFRFAQFTAEASDTTVEAESVLFYLRVN